MDAVKFLKEQARMCGSFGDNCDGCPLCGKNCGRFDTLVAEQKVEAVEKWSKEHPQKTRMSEFMKQHPNLRLDEEGVPSIFPCDIDEELFQSGNCSHCCSKRRENYWLEKIE